MRIVLLGAPGAGKGTQAEFVSSKLGVPSISTGNLLRAAMAEGSELGKRVASYMDSGALVPDEIILELVADRLSRPDCEKGAVFDGFPRTVAQAEALEEMAPADMALLIDVHDDEIVRRMGGRRFCPHCQSTYHIVSHPPRAEGICDKCGEALSVRPDDTPEVVRNRLEVYHRRTEPLIDFYRSKGTLRTVRGQDRLEDTTALVAEAIGVEV